MKPAAFELPLTRAHASIKAYGSRGEKKKPAVPQEGGCEGQLVLCLADREFFLHGDFLEPGKSR